MTVVAQSDKMPSGHALEQFVLLAKSARGAAAAQLVRQALSAPGVFVFSELLDMPNIKELASSSDHSATYKLLELFAYDDYSEYLRRTDELPSLTPAELVKLRHLSIVSMATSCKSILYPDLMSKLDIEDTRELEDTVISAIYADVIRGRLDPVAGQLNIQYVCGRDVRPDQLYTLCEPLSRWGRSCEAVMADLSRQLQLANQTKENAAKQRSNVEEQAAAIAKVVKSHEQEDSFSGNDMLMPFLERSKKPKMKSAKASSSTASSTSTNRIWKAT